MIQPFLRPVGALNRQRVITFQRHGGKHSRAEPPFHVLITALCAHGTDMKNMTPEQREAGRKWAAEWREVLGRPAPRPIQDKPVDLRYTLDSGETVEVSGPVDDVFADLGITRPKV